MAIFVVTYDHPDETGWRDHVMAHVEWLQDRLADGSLLASGPLPEVENKAALLIVEADDRDAVHDLIATDPFHREGLIASCSIRVWNPIFGAFNTRSTMPGQLQTR